MKLVIQNLSKQYRGGIWGLQDFSLALDDGVFGLLGPNGAGKTTLMNILATLTRPTTGDVLWKGESLARNPDRLRVRLGYLPQIFGVYPNLNAVEFLGYIAAMKGLARAHARQRIDDLLELVNLSDARNRPLGSFSGGMKQRVGIAQALLNDPELLIVDEPTAGLDPEERVRFRNLLGDLSGERVVLLSTHIVSDVEAVASEIALIKEGRLLARGSPETLMDLLSGKVWRLVIAAQELEAARSRYQVSTMVRRHEGVHLRIVADSPPTAQASPLEPTLEDAYLYFISAPNHHPLSTDSG